MPFPPGRGHVRPLPRSDRHPSITSRPRPWRPDSSASRPAHCSTAPTPTSRPFRATATLLGALFERLVSLSVRTYAEASDAAISHLRGQGGDREVALIITRADGRLVAINVKLGAVPHDRDVRHLRWLHRQVGADLVDAAVITTGAAAYRRPDGIAVIPAAPLGP